MYFCLLHACTRHITTPASQNSKSPFWAMMPDWAITSIINHVPLQSLQLGEGYTATRPWWVLIFWTSVLACITSHKDFKALGNPQQELPQLWWFHEGGLQLLPANCETTLANEFNLINLRGPWENVMMQCEYRYTCTYHRHAHLYTHTHTFAPSCMSYVYII